MGIWQKWLGRWARWWNTQIKFNQTQVHDQMNHPVYLQVHKNRSCEPLTSLSVIVARCDADPALGARSSAASDEPFVLVEHPLVRVDVSDLLRNHLLPLVVVGTHHPVSEVVDEVVGIDGAASGVRMRQGKLRNGIQYFWDLAILPVYLSVCVT